jgi:hypothetical protein
MGINECCNQNCNQGRDCPKRSLSEEITEGFKALDQLGLAESIIKQQQLEIEALRNQLWELKSEPWGFDRKASE